GSSGRRRWARAPSRRGPALGLRRGPGGALGRGRALHPRRLLRSKLRRALCVTLDVTFRRGRVLHPRRLLRSELRCALCVTLRRGLALHPRRALCVAFYLTFRGGLLLDLRRGPRVTFGRGHPLGLRRTRIRAGAAMLRPEFPIAARWRSMRRVGFGPELPTVAR